MQAEKNKKIKKAKKAPKAENIDINKAMAEAIVEIKKKRKEDRHRKHLEKLWKEIDRQLRMEPDLAFKHNADGSVDRNKNWMPESELPQQSITLEILTADAKRLQFPRVGKWFTAHANMTDEYLKRADFSGLISGDENEVPSALTQDNADKLVEGVLNGYHKQYDFKAHVDLINAEAFKYSAGIGRLKLVNKSIFSAQSKGVMALDRKIPVLIPRTIKNFYPDDSQFSVMNEGYEMGPLHIECTTKKLSDLKLAAKGDDADGWISDAVKAIEADKDGNIEVIEAEGDFMFYDPSSKSDALIPAVNLMVACGKGDPRVIRIRDNEFPFNSYLINNYHREHVDSIYGSSPLIKGYAVQKPAVEALNRALEAGSLSNMPPVAYDRSDPVFAANGGPRIEPNAKWGTIGDVKVQQIGNPAAMFAIYQGFLQQYENTTGINAPRLGQQTVSHTTAFAKEAELARGTVRTVDYVDSSIEGFLSRLLYMEYEMIKTIIGKEKKNFYLDGYGGFVSLNRDHLPNEVEFEVIGSAGPADEQQKMAVRSGAFQQVIQIEQLKVQQAQLGIPAGLNYDAMQREILHNGGVVDTDKFITSTPGGLPGATPDGSTIPGAGGVPGNAAPAALQALSQLAG